MARVVLTPVIALLCVLAAQADDRILNSKHDLSVMGPGPIRAIDETRVCIFCHVPHNASPAAPLWNRYNPTTYYRVYRSPTMVARPDQPGPASKLCLSCHDGSIAIGLTLDRPLTDPILMSHPYIPSGPSNLTSDLSDDHPIGFRYDRALANHDPQIRQPELVDHRIKLGPLGQLECVACHDPHNNALGNFLRITDREGSLCNTCHQLEGWPVSTHALSPRSVPVTVTLGEQLPYRSMADNACRSCHMAHSAPYREHLLYDRPSRLCLTCHDGLTAQNMLPVVDQRYGHRINKLFGHVLPPEERLRVTRTVECTDCHNPHAVLGTAAAGRIPSILMGPQVPPAMNGVPGVNLVGLPVPRAAMYYEVCFRCHSDRPVIITHRIIRQRDDTSNVRRQFLPTAASAHPVTFPSRNVTDVPSLRPELKMRSFITCQDCHNNPDAEVSPGLVPNGPHGSRFNFMLVAQYETQDYTMESPQAYALCYRCHERTSILSDQSFSLHRKHIVRDRTPCSACHTGHGVTGSPSEHDHLINFDISIVNGERFYRDTGNFSGTCTLTCHGVRHVNFTYQQ